jgi:hypothetical protein
MKDKFRNIGKKSKSYSQGTVFECFRGQVLSWMQNIWCDYNSRNDFIGKLKGAMRIDRSKDMSVHVSTCIHMISTQQRQLCGSWSAQVTSRRKNEWPVFREMN